MAREREVRLTDEEYRRLKPTMLALLDTLDPEAAQKFRDTIAARGVVRVCTANVNKRVDIGPPRASRAARG